MARKKKQEVILLHGNSQFNMAAAEAVSLKQGELVIEHGDEGVKLHTLDKDATALGTFITETAIDAKIASFETNKVNTVAARVETLETVVGDENKGLVKGVADNAAAIEDIQAVLGLDGEAGTTISGRLDALEGLVGDAESGLVKDVDALQTIVGDAESGLVKGVADNAAAIEAQGEEIEAIQNALGLKEGAEGTIAGRLEAVEGVAAENAQDILALEGVVGDANGGLVKDVAELKADLNTETTGIKDRLEAVEGKAGDNATEIKKLQDELNGTTGENAVVGIKDRLTAVEGKATDNATAIGQNKTATENNAAAIAALDKTVNGYMPEGEGAEFQKGLVDKVADNTAAIETLGQEAAKNLKDAIEKLDLTATDDEKAVTKYVSYVEQVDGQVSATYATLDAENVAFTPAEPAGTLSGIATVKAALDALNAKDVVLAGEIDDVDARIDAILGSDKAAADGTQKTIRTIAAEEIAAQLIPENAADALNSLQEIAAWIQEHPEDAAAMNADITELQTILDGYVTVTTDDEGKEVITVSTVKTDIKRLDDKDVELNNAITALTKTVTDNQAAVADYTVNGKKVSENPVLSAADIKMTTVVGETEATEQTVQAAVAKVQANLEAAKEDLAKEIAAIDVQGGEGVQVNKAGSVYTVNITKIDAGSYDDVEE